MSPTEKAVLLALLFWARDKAACWPSDASIGTRIGRCPGTVQRALRRLEALGLVERRKVTTNATGRELVLRWRVTPEAPAREPRLAQALDEWEKSEKSKTPRTGPPQRPAAAESKEDPAAEAAELRRLVACEDLAPPIRRMAARALAQLAEAPADVAPQGHDRGTAEVDEVAGPPTAEGRKRAANGAQNRAESPSCCRTAGPPMRPPALPRDYRRAPSRSPWVEALARHLGRPPAVPDHRAP